MKSVTNIEAQGGMTSGFIGIVKNILLCFVFTAVFLFAFAVIITYTNFPDKFIPPLVITFTVISIALAGIMTAKKCFSKGWLSGGLTGLIYMLLLYCIGSLMFRSFNFDGRVITMLLIGVFSGMFGGIVGINTKKRR